MSYFPHFSSGRGTGIRKKMKHFSNYHYCIFFSLVNFPSPLPAGNGAKSRTKMPFLEIRKKKKKKKRKNERK